MTEDKIFYCKYCDGQTIHELKKDLTFAFSPMKPFAGWICTRCDTLNLDEDIKTIH